MYKKIILISALASALMAGKTIENPSSITSKYPMLNTPNLKVVKGIEHDSFQQFEIEVNTGQGIQRTEVFIPKKSKDVVFVGKAFSPKGEPIELPKSIKTIKDGVAFSMGDGKEDIYVVTDPDCPWCQKLEVDITPKAKAKYRVNIIPMPLQMHPNAKNVLYWVLSAKDAKEKTQRMHDYMVDSATKKVDGVQEKWKDFQPTDEQKKAFDAILAKAELAAAELGARGTPSIYNSKMNKMEFTELVNVK